MSSGGVRGGALDGLAMGLLVLLCASWGLQQVAVKVAAAGIPPVLQAGLRSLGALLLVWAWTSWRGIRPFAMEGMLAVAVLAGILFGVEFVLLYAGLALTQASRAVVLLYTAPFVVALGSHLFVPGERIGRLQWIGLLCAFAGVVLAFADGLAVPDAAMLAGDAMVLAAAVFWGATTVLIKATRLTRVGPERILFHQLLWSAPLMFAVSALLGEAVEPRLASTPEALLGLAYQIVVVASASYLVWFWLVGRYSAARLSSFSFLTPLFGTAAGALLLDERISAAFLLAMALVGAGIYLVNARESRGA